VAAKPNAYQPMQSYTGETMNLNIRNLVFDCSLNKKYSKRERNIIYQGSHFNTSTGAGCSVCAVGL
jgi:hypothetical protein